jgi:hypothetical protein
LEEKKSMAPKGTSRVNFTPLADAPSDRLVLLYHTNRQLLQNSLFENKDRLSDIEEVLQTRCLTFFLRVFGDPTPVLNKTT